jgi:hypothetical protein
MISEADVLTAGTELQILTLDEEWERVCGGKPSK